MDIVVFALSALALALALIAFAVPMARRVGLPLPVAVAAAGLAAGTTAAVTDFSLAGTALSAFDLWFVEQVAFDSSSLLHVFLPPLLFDLEADPGELKNLAEDPAYQGVRLRYAEKLLNWRARHLERTLTGVELTPDGLCGKL